MKLEIDNPALETAKSKVVYGVVADSCECSHAVSKSSTIVCETLVGSFPCQDNSFIDQVLLGAPKDWRKTFVSRVQDITKEDVRETLRRYFIPLFDPEKSVAVVASSPADSEKLLTARGYEVLQLGGSTCDDGK